MVRTALHSIKFNRLCKATKLEDLQTTAHLSEYLKFQQRSKAHFAQKLDQFNQIILSKLDELLEQLPQRNENELFQDRHRMRAATLAMDVRTSDHEPTFDCIENYVKKQKKMPVLRIKPDMVRKRGLLELMEPFKNRKQVFVLVEQTETLGPLLIEQLSISFKNRLESDLIATDLVFILFCTSSNMPLLELASFQMLHTISCDKEIECDNILEDLIRNEDFPFKMAPVLLAIVYGCFVQVDPSFANLELMFNYTMYEYFSRRKVIVDNTTANAYHSFICDQLYYYLDLLKDQYKFPEEILDLYNELFQHDELGHSVDTVDAIKGLIKFPIDRLIKRIEHVESRAKELSRKRGEKYSGKKVSKKDVLHILLEYKEKLINNEDNKEIVSSLRNDLLEHVQQLKNPTKVNYGHIYIQKMRYHQFIKWLRCDIMNTMFERSDPFFRYLHDRIQSSPGVLSANDLFNDMIGEHSKLDEGLAKAIFIDLMDGMEQNQLIKWDKKRGQEGGMIKRLVWLH